MKKQVLIGSVLLAAISAFSQSGRVKPKPTGIMNSKLIAEAKFGGNESATPVANSASPNASLPTNSGSKTSVSNTWIHLTSSMNIYGSVIPYGKPLQWNDELNAISFIHRKSPTYSTAGSSSQTESGSIAAMISMDCGNTWDSTLVYADVTNRGRYPQGGIYNPPSTPTNTDISNAYIVANGPVTHGSGWVGNFYASKQLGTANYNGTISAVPNAVQYYSSTGSYTNLAKHDFSAYGFTATDDGKVRTLAGVQDDALASDTAVMLVTGTFNNGVFDWSGTVFNPPTVMASDGTEQWISRPLMAWNEMGNIGYVIIMGANFNGVGANVGYQPIVYRTSNSGATWSLENSIDFNNSAFSAITDRINSVNTQTNLAIPFFNWLEGMDATVDANGKLHIFSTVLGTPLNHPDSLNYISSFGTEGYRWGHEPGWRPYLYDFIYDGVNWSYLTVDSMSTEGPAGVSTGNGYQDNPWDMDPAQQNQKVRIDARLQMSRTPDGKYIVYTWAESDTNFTNNQKKWNTLPNVKARVLDVTTGLICQTGPNLGEINITASAPGDVSGRAMYHFISPKCRLSSTVTANGPVISLPITVSNSNPYAQLSPNKHWFSHNFLNFGNVPDPNILLCGPVAMPNNPVGLNENSNSANSSYVFPNPTKNNATLHIDLVKSTTVQIEVLNTIGQVVKSVKTEGQSGANSINVELNGLSSGIYMVNVKAGDSNSTKKLIIE